MPPRKPRKIFDYPIKELKELLRDLRRDWRDMKYWEGLYNRKGHYDHLDSDTKDSIKKALKGLRFKKTILEKKIHSVASSIIVLQENNNFEYVPKDKSKYIFLTK